MRAPLALALSTVALALQGCPSCPYEEACDGNTLKYCYLGVDQLVGSPEEGERPCEAPNPVCITVDDQRALCGIDSARTCTSSVARCENGLRVSCSRGFEFAEDCSLDGNTCGVEAGKAACRELPLIPCEPSWNQRCDGDVRRMCNNGFVIRQDCSRRGETCRESTNEYGTSAFCASP